MKISTNTGFSPDLSTLAEAIPLIRNAGFDCFDLSLFGMKSDDDEFNRSDYVAKAKELRKIADDCGISCNQSHAPFPTSYNDDTPEHIEANGKLPDKLRRSLEVAAIVGAKAIVVHPKHHLHWTTHSEELKELNRAFYTSLLPSCREYGIRVAVENMWQQNRYGKGIIDSACSRPDEFAAYMEMLDPEWFVACLDIGHCTLTDHAPTDMIRALGHKHLHALHVHDNDGVGDLHTLPFQPKHAKVDWVGVTDALAEIDYDGELTLEADYFHTNIPRELLPATLRYMAEVARYLANEVDRKKAAK